MATARKHRYAFSYERRLEKKRPPIELKAASLKAGSAKRTIFPACLALTSGEFLYVGGTGDHFEPGDFPCLVTVNAERSVGTLLFSLHIRPRS
jgi:hypothetical protein